MLATDKNGEEIEGTAKAVIVATGGFGDNTKMIEEETGMKWGQDLFSFRIPGLMGDGIRMVREVGGAPTSVGMEVIYCMPQTTDQLPGVARVFSQPNIMVNLDGERFINEDIMENTTFTGNAIMLQKKRCGFTIIDSSIIKQYRRKGIDVISLVHPTFDIGDFEGDVERALAAGNTDIFVADTLEELAEKTGINCENLLATIEEYNDMCESGDTLFNKPKKYMRAIKKGPYYAGRFFPSAYGTLGGFKVNYKLEVENTSGDVIKGLYGAGTDVCTIYGDSYVFILPGNTMGFCINSGRMAGENAAAFVQGN